ncbi:MAG: hypothetical protein WKF30_19385 [Pyrinomonadaceae bacterium]
MAETGKVKWICREPSCKDHLYRVPDAYSRPISGGDGGRGDSRDASVESIAKRQRRKQELFEVKINETVRKRVFAEAIKTYDWPLERAHLNEVVCEFFRCIPTDDQKTIGEVFDFDEERAAKFRHDAAALLEELAKLTDARLAQLMVLCSFGHYGSNPYPHNQVDQSRVTQLAAERGVDYALVDAEARAERAPKKYRAEHERYLAAVRSGKRPERRPVVYERLRQHDGGESEETSEASEYEARAA